MNQFKKVLTDVHDGAVDSMKDRVVSKNSKPIKTKQLQIKVDNDDEEETEENMIKRK